jgi:hypothetical protein
MMMMMMMIIIIMIMLRRAAARSNMHPCTTVSLHALTCFGSSFIFTKYFLCFTCTTLHNSTLASSPGSSHLDTAIAAAADYNWH